MSNAAMTKANDKTGTLRAYLESPQVKSKLAEVAGKFMKPEGLIRMTLMALSRQPQIADCVPHSIVRALMDAAALGVAPGGMMGRGYIVPRKNRSTGQLEACFDPGYRGLIDIARRTGKIKSIEAHAVYEADEFHVDLGDDGKIHHRPAVATEDRGAVIGAYAIAIFHDGSRQREFLTKADLTKIRNVSMAKSGPWASWEEEMSRKSAVRRLCKYLPYDDQLERAMGLADDVETGERIVDVSLVQADKPRSKQLAEKLRAKVAGAKEESETESPPEEDAPTEEQPPEVDDLGGRM